MSNNASQPNHLHAIARRYGIEARGLECLHVVSVKIATLIAEAQADLDALRAFARQLDDILASDDGAASRVKREFSSPPPLSVALERALPDILAAIDAGHCITAIKLYREATGCSLGEAKQGVEQIQSRRCH